MNWIDALILGIVQGLTEFLPISSSGHLEVGKAILGTRIQENLQFTIVVHGATVLSTIVVFAREILKLIKESLTFKYNDSLEYILKIIVSTIPVLVVGLLFKDSISTMFDGNLIFIGSMLIVTSVLLSLTRLVKTDGIGRIPFIHAFIIGIAQAIAVIPGISRSGATIVTGLILGNKREDVAKFSFLMVLIPIIGANILDYYMINTSDYSGPDTEVLIIGFITAFISGLVACKWMINLVKKGNLIYFSLYCLILGISAIIFA